MNKPIVNASLKFNCSANWDEMSDTNGGKNCHQCKKTVYDFTNSNQNEFDLILAENNYNICGRFNNQQLLSPSKNLPVWKKWVSAAMVLIGFNTYTSKAVAQTTQEPVKQQDQASHIINHTMGEVLITVNTPPVFPGGDEALNDFLKRTVNYKIDVKAKVLANFSIDTAGNVKNFKILNGRGSITNEAALRVIKLSPKWKPATHNRKPVDYNVSFPVTFQK